MAAPSACPSVLRRLALRLLALVVIVGLGVVGPAPTLRAEPLKIPGKTTLYQRVLTRPGATIVDAPGSDHRVKKPPVFSVYYVFQDVPAGADSWLQVGPAQTQAPIGWIRKDKTVPWWTNMVLTFANPVSRLPTLFFDSQASLQTLLGREDLTRLARAYVADARRGSAPAGSGILSIEPDTWVDHRSRFYLVPILETRQTLLDSGARGTMVRMASIPAPDDTETAREADEPAVPRPYKVGIMFVIDSTQSMGPYIDRTRKAIRRLQGRIQASAVGENVSFGAIAYRDNTSVAPGLGYTVRTASPLRQPPDHAAFLRDLDTITPATASSRNFREDGLAGVVEAINSAEWDKFDGRYIIVITDASLRDGDDPLSATGLNVAEVNRMARAKTIAILSVLLATPEGRPHHDQAEDQLRRLSQWNERDHPPFYRVPNGALDRFGRSVDRLTESLINQIDTAARFAAGEPPPSPGTGERAGHEEGGLIAATEDIGLAMQMAWLGRSRGTTAPDIIEGWAADFALDDPGRRAFDIQVALTKVQLSRMNDALKLVLEAGEASLASDPDTFFDQLRSIVARALRDGTRLASGGPAAGLGSSPIDSLGDLMGEYVSDLPYNSQLTELTPTRWRDLGPSEQDRIIATVRSKQRSYQHIHDDTSYWHRLSEDAPDDEAVALIPLGAMP